MGERPKGYSYSYEFSSVGMGDIISRRKSLPLIPEEDRVFIFEIRAEFFIKWTPKRLGVSCEIIGSERFDISPISVGCAGEISFPYLFFARLKDYWMNEAEIMAFCNNAIAFALPLAAECADMNRIPIAVQFEVCTVQQEGESTQDAVGRAIYPDKLFPLYLWINQSAVRRPLGFKLKEFLFKLNKIRANNRELGKAVMPQCYLCYQKTETGDQITKLPQCGCAFHYHCLVLKLEKSNQCPGCASQVYDCSLLEEPDDFGIGTEI